MILCSFHYRLVLRRNTDISLILFTEDKSDKRTKEENRPDSTPETTARTAEVGSHASGARRKLDLGEDGKSVFVICILTAATSLYF